MPLYVCFLWSLNSTDPGPSFPRSTYYTKDYRQSAALIRARQPFLIKNIFTGLGIASFVIGVCKFYCLLGQAKGLKICRADLMGHTDAFTISAVAQDDFSDVQIPDAVQQPPHTPHAGALKTPSEVSGRQ